MKKKSRRNTGASFWVPIIFGLVFIVAIVAFAIQTWELVDTIFPAENLFMKVATVINLDVMSILYASAEMFYPFRDKSTKHLAFGMWVCTFIGALLASIIYMYLSSLHLLHGALDIRYLYLAYGIVVLAMSANIIAITVGIRLEWNAALDEDDDEQDELPAPRTRVQSIPQGSQYEELASGNNGHVAQSDEAFSKGQSE